MTKMIINSVLALALLHISMCISTPEIPQNLTLSPVDKILHNPQLLKQMNFTLTKDRKAYHLILGNLQGSEELIVKLIIKRDIKANVKNIKLKDVEHNMFSSQGLILKFSGTHFRTKHSIGQPFVDDDLNKDQVIDIFLKQLNFIMTIFSMTKDTEFKDWNLGYYIANNHIDEIMQFASPASSYVTDGVISRLIWQVTLNLSLFKAKNPEDKLECMRNMNTFIDNPQQKLEEFIPKVNRFFVDIYRAIETDLLKYPKITETLSEVRDMEEEKPINIQSILPFENESYCALKPFINDSLGLREKLVAKLEKITEIKQEKLNAAMEADLFNKIKEFNDLLSSPISSKDWAKYLEKMVSMLPTIEGKVLYVDREGRVKRNPKKTCPENIEALSYEQLQAKLPEEDKMIEELWWSKTASGYSFKAVFAEDTNQLSLEQDNPNSKSSSSCGTIKQEVAKEDLSELLNIENEAQPVHYDTNIKGRNKPKPQSGVKIHIGKGNTFYVTRSGEECPEYTGFLQAALRGETVTLGKNALGKTGVDEKYHYAEMVKFVKAIENQGNIEVSSIVPNQYGQKNPVCLIARPKGDGFEINLALSNRKGEVSIWRPQNK